MSNKIHIVKIKVNDDFAYTAYLHLFRPDVVRHIQSFRFQHDQVVAFASALLKYYYLAKILCLPLASIVIQQDEFGRPFLANNKSIDFSISHSGDYVVMVVVWYARVGVDIECLSLKMDKLSMLGIAKSVYSKPEQELFHADTTITKFYLLWTKKEALLKAIGVGFASELYKKTNLDLNLNQEFNFAGVPYISCSQVESLQSKVQVMSIMVALN